MPLVALVIRSLLLFSIADTLAFPGAWIFLAISFACDCAAQVYLARGDESLRERRASVRSGDEPRARQRRIRRLTGWSMIAVLAVSAFDRRSDWSHMPIALSGVGAVMIAVGCWTKISAFRANKFASTCVTTHPGQTVATTGAYKRVRHPMYLALVLECAAAPLVLGSWYGLVASGMVVVMLVLRLLDEEGMLAETLDGYQSYRRQVPRRLIPLVW